MKKSYCTPSLHINELYANDILTQSGDTEVAFDLYWIEQGGGF